MNDSKVKQLQELIQTAENRPLTEAEQGMLTQLLAEENGRLAARGQQHLQRHYQPVGQERRWSATQLTHIAANIENKRAGNAVRTRRKTQVRQFALAMSLILLLVGVFGLRPFINQLATEPAIQIPISIPSPTPLPTPTLRPNFRYANLFDEPIQINSLLPQDIYTKRVSEVAAQWDGDLYLPTQLPTSWQWIGARLTPDTHPLLELAFVQDSIGSDTIWIISQAPANGRALTPPLPVTYLPLPRTDETLTYDDKAIEVGNQQGWALQYEYVYREQGQTEWVVYNSVTWQQGEQLITLTLVDDNLNASSLIAALADQVYIQKIE
ncbi:MAG: hypothetical protein AAF614_20710 [Chloroflexota bacterium]